MDIQKTTEFSTAFTKIGDDITINYAWQTTPGKPVDIVNATILKGLTRVGYFNTNSRRESALTFQSDNGLTTEERQQIGAAVYADEAEILAT